MPNPDPTDLKWGTTLINFISPDGKESTLHPTEIEGMTFHEIAAKHGEDAAINAGIAADPDTFELTKEWFAEARPAIEVDPHTVARWLRSRNGRNPQSCKQVTLPLDLDLLLHFLDSGQGWEKRLNDTLRRAVFGSTTSQ